MTEPDLLTKFDSTIKNQAYSMAKKFHHCVKSRLDTEDFVSQAQLIALESYKNYDATRQPDLAKYIGVNVYYGLIRYICANMHDVHVPYQAQYDSWKNESIMEDFAHLRGYRIVNGDGPTAGDPSVGKMVYNECIDADSNVFASGTTPPIDGMERDEDIKIMKEEFDKLSCMEQYVLMGMYGADEKQTKRTLAANSNTTIKDIESLKISGKNKLKQNIELRHGA